MHNVFFQTPDIFSGGAPLHLKQWGSTVNLKKSIINSVPTWIINDMAHDLIRGKKAGWFLQLLGRCSVDYFCSYFMSQSQPHAC